MNGTPSAEGTAESMSALLLYRLDDSTVTASLLSPEDGSVQGEPVTKTLDNFSPEQFGLTVPMLWDLVDHSGASITSVVVSGAASGNDIVSSILELAFGVPVFDAAVRSENDVASASVAAPAVKGRSTSVGTRPVPAKPVRRTAAFGKSGTAKAGAAGAGAAAAGAAAVAATKSADKPPLPTPPSAVAPASDPTPEPEAVVESPEVESPPVEAPVVEKPTNDVVVEKAKTTTGPSKSAALKTSLFKPVPVPAVDAVTPPAPELDSTAIVGGVHLPADDDTDSFPVVPPLEPYVSDAPTESIPVVSAEPAAPHRPSRRVAVAVGVAAAALIAVGIGSAAVLSGGSEDAPMQNAASTQDNPARAEVPAAAAPADPTTAAEAPPVAPASAPEAAPVDDPTTAVDESLAPTPEQVAAARAGAPWTASAAAPPATAWTAPPAASGAQATEVPAPQFTVPVPENDPSKSQQQLQDEAWARHWEQTGQWLNQEFAN